MTSELEPLPPEGNDPTPASAAQLARFSALGFFAADHAAVENNKVYASGAFWNILRFPAFPATLPSIALVAVLQQPFHQALSDHTFAMQLVDSDEKALDMNVEGQFRVAPGIESRYGDSGIIPIAVPIYGMSFERPGDYSFVLKVDGLELDRYAFKVIQVVVAGIAS
jgi:uncharacterized protein DUF6941